MDRGLFATALDPKTGRQEWRVRLATDPIHAKDGNADLGGLFTGPWIRKDQTINIPPQIIGGKLQLIGNLAVDPSNPRDHVIGGAGYTP